ncbi:hypothetical protein N9N03_01630 [Chlamydiia bacterium]|jgi:hypothetical protein|nr:hypothetical protein [Chlamydiia bacterium]
MTIVEVAVVCFYFHDLYSAPGLLRAFSFSIILFAGLIKPVNTVKIGSNDTDLAINQG